MAKITLTDVANLQNEQTAVNTINNNSAAIEEAFENTLSRDGEAPNQMESNFDMNDNQILNLPVPGTLNSPLRLQDLVNFNGGGTISSLPPGGTTGQALVKNSNADYNVGWANSVTSVGLAMPADLQVTNSPVTTFGTLTADWTTPPTGTGAMVRTTSPTLTTPSISQISNTGTLTLPTSTDTLVGRATTDTLTNKSIDAAQLTGSINTARIAANTVSNSQMTQAPAWTLKGNPTGSTGNVSDFNPSALTQKVSPIAADMVMIADSAASNQLKYALVSSLGGGGSGVASLNGQTGALVNYYPPQGRLTLVSGTPVMQSNQAGATIVYYTPAAGNIVPIYNGTDLIPTVVNEISQTTTDSTKSPAAVANNSVYDVFIWNDSGTIRATRGPAWTNSTTRGYTFTSVNGILLNTSSITNGPAASRGTWVGTIASNGTASIDYILGGTANGGVAGRLMVWNAYNRKAAVSTVVDNTSYSYASATIRQAHASAGNQCTFVLGAQEDAVSCTLNTTIVIGAGGAAGFGVGFDSITGYGQCPFVAQSASAVTIGGPAGGQWNCPIGVHYVASLENSAIGSTQFNTQPYTVTAILNTTVWN